jgi:hypothetical protein
MIPGVQADYLVELGHDDPVLEFPWNDPENGCQYFDLKRSPELLAALPEAANFHELHGFLATLNSSSSMFETAKCDAWSTTEMSPEEDIFEATWKFGSYIDFIFSAIESRFSFESHEAILRGLTQLLRKSPDIPAAAEFLIRRCYYHRETSEEGAFGFYVSAYVFGFGESEEQARKQWAIALKLVENAIRQISVTARN